MPDESPTPDLVELVRRQAEAANRRDLDAVLNAFAEDAIMTGGPRAPFDPSLMGRVAIRRFMEDWIDAFEELHFEFEEVSDLGNGVVFAVLNQEGRLVGSAAHVEQREGWVYIWARGLIARLETTYLDIDEGRAAAERLSEERRWAVSEEPTTSELVRLARQGYEAMSRGDLDGVMSVFAANAILDFSAAGLGTFEGAEEIRSFVEDWRRNYEDYRYDEVEFLDLGHSVLLSVVRESGSLVGGKGRIEERVAHLMTWANGKIEWYKHYPDPDEARTAAGRLAKERA